MMLDIFFYRSALLIEKEETKKYGKVLLEY